MLGVSVLMKIFGHEPKDEADRRFDLMMSPSEKSVDHQSFYNYIGNPSKSCRDGKKKCHLAAVKIEVDKIFGRISSNNENSYQKEINNISGWCSENNLLLRVNNCKELIFDLHQ